MNFGRDDYNQFFSQVQCNIPEDEPVFLLRASDPLCSVIIIDYLAKLTEHEADPKVIDSIHQHTQRIIQWQREYGTKNADLVRMEKSKVDATLRIEQIIESLEVDSTITSTVFNELQDLMCKLYGPNSIMVLTYNQYEVEATGHIQFKVTPPDECLLLLGVDKDKTWRIFMNRL